MNVTEYQIKLTDKVLSDLADERINQLIEFKKMGNPRYSPAQYCVLLGDAFGAVQTDVIERHFDCLKIDDVAGLR